MQGYTQVAVHHLDFRGLHLSCELGEEHRQIDMCLPNSVSCHVPCRWKLNLTFIPDEFGLSQREADKNNAPVKNVAEKETQRK